MPSCEIYRAALVESANHSDEQRSVELVLATEDPQRAYDDNLMEIVQEAVRLDGMDVPDQVPLVDTHNRESVQHVLGSIRDFRVENGKLIGRAYFASDDISKSIYEKYRDGHLTDFSLGAVSLERQYEDKDGVMHAYVTQSRLIEGSAVVAGQDSGAKMLRNYTDPETLKEERMNEELRKLLIERGLAKDATDKDTLEFIEKSLTDKDDPLEPGKAVEIIRSLQDELRTKPDLKHDVEAETKRCLGIHDLCATQGVEQSVIREYIESGKTREEVAVDILERKQNERTGPSTGIGQQIQHGLSEREKFYEAAQAGIMQRALAGIRIDEATSKQIHEVAGANDFRHQRIANIAREFVNRAGGRVDGLPDHEVIKRAIKQGEMVERSSYHTTGSFPQLFLNAMNKTLRAAYDEAPATYSQWVRQAASASDYKELNRIVFGEINLPSEVPENTEYPTLSAGDAKESYRVRKHGGIFPITLEMMVNDDLDAMNRIPRMQGNAMRRKINRDVYSVLVSNPTMADGVALFHATSHGANLDTNALDGTTDEADLDTGFEVMMTQSGLDTSTVLGIMPRFLIVPAALSARAYRLVSGGVVPESTANVNLYGQNGPRPLTVIVDGQIDNLGGTAMWFLAADNNVVDTIEITYLQGEESPVLEREDEFTTDVIKYKIRQSYGIKAIDYRGLYRGN